MHYVDTSNVYFTGVLFVDFFSFFCETGIKNEHFCLQSNLGEMRSDEMS